jgi:hypothetical protein
MRALEEHRPTVAQPWRLQGAVLTLPPRITFPPPAFSANDPLRFLRRRK